jgi:hypothetical protein
VTPKRESTTHGPRVDEELKRETSPLVHGGHMEERAQDGRELEGAGDGEPRPELGGASGLPRDPALARRELSRHLRIGVFPASRDELLAEAEENAAPQPVLDLLAGLPADERYGTVYEVWIALGGELEPGAEEVVSTRRRTERRER